MNVASLLQDSPSDDRDTRLQRQHSQQVPPPLANLSHPLQPLPNARREREKEKEKEKENFVPNNVPSRPPSRPVHPPPPADCSPPASIQSCSSAIPVSVPVPPEKQQMQAVDPQPVYDDYNPSNTHIRNRLPPHPPPPQHSLHSSSKQKPKSLGKGSRSRYQQTSQFELDWEVREINERGRQDKEKSSRVSPTTSISIPGSAPTPPLKPKPGPHNLGTFVYPHTPFPLTALPPSNRHQDVHFIVYIPHDHLPSVLPRRPSVWGGCPIVEASADGKQPVTRRIYTDDSLLTLLPLHAGFCTLSEYRQPRGDLRIVFNVLLRDSGKCPVRWVGCLGEGKTEADQVQSLSWGNGHDGNGVEILAADWVKGGSAHRLTLPNRRARLQEYAERRGQLVNISTNLPSKQTVAGVIINGSAASKLKRLSPQLSQFEITTRYSELSFESVKVGALMFEGNGRIGYKYTPESLRVALFPLHIATKNDFSSERPKKRRKVDRQSPLERDEKRLRELEIETTNGELLAFIPDSDNLNDESVGDLIGRVWSLVKKTSQNASGGNANHINGKGSNYSMDLDLMVIKNNITLVNIDFLPDSICVWDSHTSHTDLSCGVTTIARHEMGNGLSIPVRLWRWKNSADGQKSDS